MGKASQLEKVQEFPLSAEGGADHLAFWGDRYLNGTFFLLNPVENLTEASVCEVGKGAEISSVHIHTYGTYICTQV